jgi:ABC-type transport system involved in cytochrome bd biosynthesis fused ATPase/permease subunit
VIVMEHGRIAQRGTFDRLLAVDGPFRALAAQLQGPASPDESLPSNSASVARSSSE